MNSTRSTRRSRSTSISLCSPRTMSSPRTIRTHPRPCRHCLLLVAGLKLVLHKFEAGVQEALDWLAQSVDAGFDQPDGAAADEELASLTYLPRFGKLLTAMRKTAMRKKHMHKMPHAKK